MNEVLPPDPPPPAAAAGADPARPFHRRRAAWITAAAALLLVALLWRARAGAPAVARSGGKGRLVPVVTDSVRVRDFDVHFTALGTVTPLRTVTVRSRVDGQLLSVHFAEGQVVEAGALLAVLDPQPFQAQVAQAQAQLARDSALLDNAKIDLERYQHLLELDSVAKQQVDTQETLVRQDEAQVKLDEASVQSAKLQLAYTRITSEFAGRVGLRLVDPGNIVHASDPGGITVITQLQPISVLFSVPQNVLPDLLRRYQAREAQPVTVFAGDAQTPLAYGRVVSIDNQIDPTTGTIKVRAEFANSDHQLFPNQFVNVKLLLQQIAGATVVPSAAVQRGSIGTFTYVMSRGDTVHIRPVALGATESDSAVVVHGLSSGELVVVDGVDQLREGAVVQPLAPISQSGAAGRKGTGHGGSGHHGGHGGAAGGSAPASGR